MAVGNRAERGGEEREKRVELGPPSSAMEGGRCIFCRGKGPVWGHMGKASLAHSLECDLLRGL